MADDFAYLDPELVRAAARAESGHFEHFGRLRRAADAVVRRDLVELLRRIEAWEALPEEYRNRPLHVEGPNIRPAVKRLLTTLDRVRRAHTNGRLLPRGVFAMLADDLRGAGATSWPDGLTAKHVTSLRKALGRVGGPGPAGPVGPAESQGPRPAGPVEDTEARDPPPPGRRIHAASMRQVARFLGQRERGGLIETLKDQRILAWSDAPTGRGGKYRIVFTNEGDDARFEAWLMQAPDGRKTRTRRGATGPQTVE
jgi:hypothetical protein